MPSELSQKLKEVSNLLTPVLVDAGLKESDVRLHRRHIEIYTTGLRITVHSKFFMLHRRVFVQTATESDKGNVEDRFIGSCDTSDIVAIVKLAALSVVTRRIDEVIEQEIMGLTNETEIV